MVVIGDLVSEVSQLRLETRLLPRQKAQAHITQSARIGCRAVFEYALAAFVGQIEPCKIGIAFFQFIDHAQRLQVVFEAAVLAHALVERFLAGMTEGRVAQVMGQADGLGQRFVEPQRARNRAGDLRHLHGMRQPRAIEIAFVIDEHLRLVDQPAKGIGMHDAVAVALVFGAVLRRRFGIATAAGLMVQGGIRGQAMSVAVLAHGLVEVLGQCGRQRLVGVVGCERGRTQRA